MNKKVVIFGSGNIGRGLIPELLENNWEINFIDVDKNRVEQINSVSSYKIFYLNKNKNNYFEVQNFKAFGSKDKNIEKIINNASIIFTSVGVTNLVHVAKVLSKCIKKNTFKKSILAFENANKATSILKMLYLDNNGFTNKNIQFVNVIIDRIVPTQVFDPKKVCAEKQFTVIAEKKELVFSIGIKQIQLKNNLDKYIFRKFLLLNSIHSYIAWMGLDKNYKYIYEALEDKEVLNQANLLGKELIEIILSKFDFDKEKLLLFLKNTIKRFKNPLLNDECQRVGRFVLHKLSYNDRFILPYRIALQKKINALVIKRAIKLGLKIKNPTDPEVTKRDKLIKENPNNYFELITKIKKF